ncbi:unnamed protein product [Prunus armeniaca]
MKKFDLNYFTGPLPAFIGNMSALTVLSIAHNSFSGPIPKELGNLKELTMLSLGSNNLSGTLPPELGNLVNLGLFYMDSCGLSGEIPSTFAKLIKMKIRFLNFNYASDNPFSGNIPSFIGNWRKLTSLRFQGNSFEGPIPTSFSQLTSLESLRISDIYYVSSSLDFIRNLKNLTDLVLRNTLINGSIPTDFGEYQRLQILRTPKFFVQHEFSYIFVIRHAFIIPLFCTYAIEFPAQKLSRSSHLFLVSSFFFSWVPPIIDMARFLGNNSLSGPLPSQKSNQLQTNVIKRFVLQLFLRKLSPMGNHNIATSSWIELPPEEFSMQSKYPTM